MSNFFPMSLLSLLPKGVSLIQGIHLFIQVIGGTYAVNLASAAATTLVAYDIVLTFSDEVELIWKASWSFPKVLYFFARYYALFSLLFYVSVSTSTTVPFTLDSVDDISPRCRGWLYYVTYGALTATVLFGEGMFLLRLYACYERNKKILVLIVFLYVAEIATAIVVGILEGRLVPILPRPPNFPMPGCFTLATVPLTMSLSAWILDLVIATIYLALMIHKFATGPTFKAEPFQWNPLVELSELRRLSPVIYLLLRDGVSYFALVFLVNLMNLIVAVTFNGRALEIMGVVWLMAVYSIASSRLCLNLRGAVSHQMTSEIELTVTEDSNGKDPILSTVVNTSSAESVDPAHETGSSVSRIA